jgi:SAM-dependent methyltransferase
MDNITRQVSEMYAKFPYPSPKATGRNLRELADLLEIFCAETLYDLNGKSVIDAGTGTGHRLVEAAAAFPNTRFTAVDISETSLAIARQTAAHKGVQNVRFHHANLMEGNKFDTFDVVLCMGVIHHLSEPSLGLRNLVRNLADDGILFLYIYGKHGGGERMRRKRMVSLLLNGNKQDFEQGISFIKELGFDSFEYGWNLNFDDEVSRNALIVDAYLHVNETLYEVESIFDLMRGAGLDRFLIFGLTLDKYGCLFDTRLPNMANHLRSPITREAYERLSLADKYRFVDLLLQPNGYTLMGFKPEARKHFSPDDRIMANALTMSDIETSSDGRQSARSWLWTKRTKHLKPNRIQA